MKTPICDFVNNYAKSDAARLHMPGHKGVSVLGCESLDITEITGADELFAPDGIIAESERNASRLFGDDILFGGRVNALHTGNAVSACGRFLRTAERRNVQVRFTR